MTTTDNDTIEQLATQEYKYGFVTDIEQVKLPAGLSEEIVQRISALRGSPTGCWSGA